jgi:hypothetical protein
MSLHQDWEGIAEQKVRLWEAEVQKRQLEAKIARKPAVWRLVAGRWLMRVGGWITHLGKQMAHGEAAARVSVAG